MMNISQRLATHLRQVYFGGNWTAVNLRDSLTEVSWQEATSRVGDLNSIATLVYHLHYFVRAASRVLQDGELDAHDKFSFDPPSIESAEDWTDFLDQIWREAEEFAGLIGRLPDEQLEAVFVEEKYGDYYGNLQGIIEHTHYHLGQIVLVKKLLKAANPSTNDF